MAIDSMPPEIDEVERRLVSLAVEKQALGKERDPASKERLAAVEREMAELRARVDVMKARWRREKEVIAAIRETREELDRVRTELELTPAARRLVVEQGTDPTYGARPLKRALQRLVADPLSLSILRGEVRPGDTVVADVRDGAVQFERVEEGDHCAIP